MKKQYWIVIFIIVVLVIVMVSIFLIPRNVWVSKNGEWVKRGNPEAPVPDFSPSKINYKEIQEIDWQVMKKVINNCEAKMVMQTHKKAVIATLKDGRKLKALEPVIDDVMKIAVEAKCWNMGIATE